MRDLRKLGAVVVCTSAALTATAVGCNSSSSPATSQDGGPSGGGDATTTTTLYQRLGGHAGIRSAVNQIVAAELGDTEIASYFVYQTMSPTPAGHPNVDQLEECLTDQLANASGGTESYPTTVTDDAGSWTCRDMATIHKPFSISGGTFSKFVMIAAGELQKLGVAASDVTIVGGVLVGEEPDIVAANLADAGEMGFDAGVSNTSPEDGGADAGTLYQRLGGHAGIRGAINQIVAAELGDDEIKSYFFNQTASVVPEGHPTVDQLEECFTDLLASVAGGTETYPTTVTDDAGSFTCRDMTTIHAPLKISGGTFSKFIMLAAGELQTLGVASTDIGTIGAVLTGTQSSIVDPNLADAGELPYDAASP